MTCTCRIIHGRGPDGPQIQTIPDINCTHPKHEEARNR